MRPTESLMRDSMCTQYIELNQKQIKEWNQRRRQKMDFTTSLKKKPTSKVRKGSIESEISNVE